MGPKTRSDAKTARCGEDYGKVRRDLDKDFGQRYLGDRTEASVQSNLARSSPVGRRIRHRALSDSVSGCSAALPLPPALLLVLVLALALVLVLAL